MDDTFALNKVYTKIALGTLSAFLETNNESPETKTEYICGGDGCTRKVSLPKGMSEGQWTDWAKCPLCCLDTIFRGYHGGVFKSQYRSRK